MNVRAPLALAFALFATPALFAAPAVAADLPLDPHDRDQVERYIRDCEHEWAAFSMNRDPTPIANFLAADFQGVSSGSKILDRQAALKPDTGPNELADDKLDYVNIRFPTPDIAIAQGRETATWKSGQRASRLWTDVWMLRNGRWRIVASHDSTV